MVKLFASSNLSIMKYYLPIVFLFCLPISVWATHNRAGDISIEQLEDENGVCGLKIRATITTYTKASSIAADRDTLTICWGDGSCEKVARINGNGNGVLLGNDIKKNIYIAEHTYPGRGIYRITMTDPNRNGGILNVNYPNSDQVPFHLATTYAFLNPQFDGCNNTPVLLQPPIDFGCVGQPFIHNPNAYDIDGDSISYQLSVPLMDVGTQVPNYVYPHLVPGNEGSFIDFNEITGDFIWDNPQIPGEYVISMLIISWRNGAPIDTVRRDMQFTIRQCEDNLPPQIEVPDEICVVAGQLIEFDVVATDPNTDDLIELSALGGPFEVSISPADDANGWANPTYQPQPVVKTFRWQTTCEHISDSYYSVVFKAVDNHFDSVGLATLKTVRIKVVGPPPQDVQADVGSGQVLVHWANPYSCDQAAADYFFGFSVWRREGAQNILIDTCTPPDLSNYGYTLIEPTTKEIQGGRYSFLDTNVARGRTYCYRIVAKFARYTNLNPPQPYNVVQSLPSNELCVQLSRDVPLMTHASVALTDPQDGQIFVSWSKPKADDLDTLLHPGPYRYELWRSTGIGTEDFVPTGFAASADEFWQANDTTFVDVGIDTRTQGYTYTIAFYSGTQSEPLGWSAPASTTYLTAIGQDEAIHLNWTYKVPWNNKSFAVFRLNPATNQWDSIGQTYEPFFIDVGLVNGREYCYYVRATGSYGIEGIADPLINYSQQTCTVPVDSMPPCPPQLHVSNICTQGGNSCDANELSNLLEWSHPQVVCPESNDVIGYRIYYAPTQSANLELVAQIEQADQFSFFHEPPDGLAGCYALTAIDSFYNESALSEIICVDNCPIYTLPNTFTPNGDGQNDLFQPYPYCFIDHVIFEVYNVWGQLVFRTEDPSLNWDGTNLSGQDLPEGTYYYICRVFEQRVEGVSERPELLRGFIELIRHKP